MTTLKQTIAKGALGTVAAGAMALATATPAAAQDYRDRDRGGIDAEDIIAGAVVIGGIAALAGAFGNDRNDRYYDRRYRDRTDYRYDRRGGYYNGRAAVERCVNAATREARRYGYRYANVTEIRDVDRERYGFKVKGRIVVEERDRYGYRNDRYGYGYRDNYRRSSRSYDKGKFTCYLDGRGRPRVDFSGIRGLR